jgi:ArsR family transcriptional regulator
MNMKPTEAANSDLNQFAKILKVIGEPNRLMLLNKIIEGVQCNCELGKSLALAPNLVSHHLSVLCDSGIVEATRDENDARWINYSINKQILDKIRHQFDDIFDLARIKPYLNTCGPKPFNNN